MEWRGGGSGVAALGGRVPQAAKWVTKYIIWIKKLIFLVLEPGVVCGWHGSIQVPDFPSLRKIWPELPPAQQVSWLHCSPLAAFNLRPPCVTHLFSFNTALPAGHVFHLQLQNLSCCLGVEQFPTAVLCGQHLHCCRVVTDCTFDTSGPCTSDTIKRQVRGTC